MDSTANHGISTIVSNDWSTCKNILIIRADNLGDLIMSSPAIRALKETFSAKITVLTSQMAAGVARFIEEIDEVITFDLPWVKTNNAIGCDSVYEVVEQLKQRHFDAAVIFTVFSQNPLPAAMLAYLANIPLRLAYCRENPYHLLTNWVPDKEPYSIIKHQVERDLFLVETVGANTTNTALNLTVSSAAVLSAIQKITEFGVDVQANWIILHAPVSEAKREYPIGGWIEAGKMLRAKGYQVLLTGTENEKRLTDTIAEGIGEGAHSIAGLLNLEEFIALIKQAPLVLSVNTGTVHIAAAVRTPIVVLYANTNPQHTPWKVPSKVLYFDVPEEGRSKNEVIQFLYQQLYDCNIKMPSAEEIVTVCVELLEESRQPVEAATHTLTPVTD
jgi:lipopolysaccharide heptosyltransferase II